MEERIGGARPASEAGRQEREMAEVTDRAHRLLRGAIERARERAMAARDGAQAAGPRLAPDLWDAAEAKAREAEAILAPGDDLPFDAYSRALRTLDEAAALYRRTEDQARDTVRPLQIETRQAREPAAGDIFVEPVVPAPATADVPPAVARDPIELGTARRGPRGRLGRAGRVAIGASALAAVAIAFFFASFYWWAASPPRESAGGFTAARSGEALRPEQQSRARASLARDEAVRAGADKLAPALFTAALQKAQEADLAQDRRDAAAAQERYREAIEAFERARDAAIRSELLARPAPPASSSPSASASTTPPSRRDAAMPTVRDQGTRESGQREAVSSTSSRIPQNVERARTGMAAARRAAEKVAAGFFAHRRFVAAQNKEREGLAALGRSEYAETTRLFEEAQSEYQTSVQEATQEAERDRQLAPLRANLERAHAAVAARRQEALAADAEQLARDAFDQAQARQVEGDGLAGRQDLVAAAQAYRDAAERYGEAIRRARAAR